jgi:hypothetical protein
MRPMRAATVSFLTLLVVQGTAYATCGTQGGPGYRGSNGKCVGWAELGRMCGCPPSTGCTAEQADRDAQKAACMGKDIDTMKQNAHKPKPAGDEHR